MTDLARRALELAEKATPGPWERDGGTWYTPKGYASVTANWIADAEFIAFARTALPALAERCLALEAEYGQIGERLRQEVAHIAEQQRPAETADAEYCRGKAHGLARALNLLDRTVRAAEDEEEGACRPDLHVRDRLAARVLALEEALEDALANTPGHSHWSEGGAGGQCEACERQRKVTDRLRAALATEEQT